MDRHGSGPVLLKLADAKRHIRPHNLTPTQKVIGLGASVYPALGVRWDEVG